MSITWWHRFSAPTTISRAASSVAVDWDAYASAIALITARVTRSGDSRAAILGDAPRAPVISALVSLADGFLRAVKVTDEDVPAISDEQAVTVLRILGRQVPAGEVSRG